ncbi:MAG: outer membrane lipid asymmetry maintenance protein MlaD [Pseudomonadota bacterium]
MRQHTLELITGTAVLAITLGFLVVGAGKIGLGGTSTSYPLVASFRSADGIQVGSEVRLGGVKVGSVSDLALNSQTFRAEATLAIDTAVVLPDDSSIIISSEGLLGGNFVELQPGGSPFNYEAGDEVFDTQGAVSLISLLLRFVAGDGE